jgi:DNA-binding PadR family transcriptional regulator
MATTKVGETSQKILCLGFVIQGEDTAQGVARRMKRRFSSERFTRGIAHKSLPSLAEDGYLELVAEGAEQPLDRYRATPEGEHHFYDWLRQTELPPTVRDALQWNIAHERLMEEKRARRERRKRSLPTDWRLELRIAKAKDAVKLGGMMTKRLKALRADLEQILDAYNMASGSEVGGG